MHQESLVNIRIGFISSAEKIIPAQTAHISCLQILLCSAVNNSSPTALDCLPLIQQPRAQRVEFQGGLKANKNNWESTKDIRGFPFSFKTFIIWTKFCH